MIVLFFGLLIPFFALVASIISIIKSEYDLFKQGKMVEYAKNLADFIATCGKKHVVLLSSLDFGRWQQIDMSRYFYLVPSLTYV